MKIEITEEMQKNPVLNNMLTRRSIRAYREEQIKDAELEALLACALYAPTGGNLQNSRFLVIQEPERMDRLNRAIRDELASREIVEGEMMAKGIRRARTEGYHFIFHAPTLITAAAPKQHSNSMANCITGLENIMLAAHALDLGSCFSNQPHWLTDVPAIREIFAEVGLREEEDIFGSVSVGYAAAEPKQASPRREGRVEGDKTWN